MSGAPRPDRKFATQLVQAVSLHRAGRIAEAKSRYAALLARDPGNGWANYFCGILAEAEGAPETAHRHLSVACGAPSAQPQFHVALGNLELARGATEPAAAAFRAAIAARVDFAAAHTGLCLALKRLDRLDEAAVAARQALWLRRFWQPGLADPPGFVDPAERAAMRQVNRVKLRHDIDQLEYLREQRTLSHEIDVMLRGLRELHERYASLPSETSLTELDEAALAMTDYGYNRLVHLAEAPRVAGVALSNAADFAAADHAVVAGKSRLALIDHALSLPALHDLQNLLRNSTIWFEIKDHGGHLGAYFEEGLACGLINQIAEELRLRMPRALGGRRLVQIWAYKYHQGLGGTDLHADVGAISANLWVTPDAANRDPNSGGMEIYPIEAPAEWDFRSLNIERERLRVLVRARGSTPVAIPYRCNRLVVFAARLVHRTMPGSFTAAYPGRRVNVTFLFA